MCYIFKKLDFRLPYTSYFGYFGCVSALTQEQYEAINDITNEFFGWGGGNE